MKKRRTWLYLTLGVLFLAISAFLYMQSHPKTPTQTMGAVPGNTIQFQVTQEDMSNRVEVKGKSSYVKETIVYAPFSAKVTQWNVNDGAQVNKGDLLYTLEDKPLKSAIEQQSAELRKQDLEVKLKLAEQAAAASTGKTLASNDAEALQQYAQASSRDVQTELERLNRSMAESELQQKQEQLAKAVQTAPESGIFLLASTTKPQLLQEGAPVGKIVDVSKLQMTTSVGEYDVFRIQPGMPVEVNIEAMKETKLAGKVERVSQFPKAAGAGTNADTAAAQFEIVISLDANAKLIAGLSLTASIQTETRQGAITVPTIAVQRDKDGTFVMVQTESGLQKRTIKIGLETPDKTEVLEGLKVGETVVLQ